MAVNQLSFPGQKQNLRRSLDYSSAWERVALGAGSAFVLLLFTTIFTAPEPPTPWAQDTKLKDWLIAHHDIFLINAYLRSLAAFLMLIFIWGVVSRVRRAEEDRLGMASLLALCGAVAFTLIMFVSQMADAAGAMLAANGGEPQTVRALAALGDTMRHFNAFSGALMMGAASVALLRARVVPRPVGWLGLLTALVFIVGAAGFPETKLEFINSTIALPLLPLWPLTLSIVLLLRSRRPKEASTE